MRRIAPWLLLGPLTGPLLCGALRAARAGRWGMAGWYALGAVEVLVLLPALAIRLSLSL